MSGSRDAPTPGALAEAFFAAKVPKRRPTAGPRPRRRPVRAWAYGTSLLAVGVTAAVTVLGVWAEDRGLPESFGGRLIAPAALFAGWGLLAGRRWGGVAAITIFAMTGVHALNNVLGHWRAGDAGPWVLAGTAAGVAAVVAPLYGRPLTAWCRLPPQSPRRALITWAVVLTLLLAA